MARNISRLALAVGFLGAHGVELMAQEVEAPGRTTTFVPTLETSISYSDFAGDTPGGATGGFVTLFRPGFTLASRTGRIRGTLSYGLGLIYRQDPVQRTDHENALSAALTAEAIENWAYVDVLASISQQALGAFGRQSVEGSLQFDRNRAEVAGLSVAPYVRGSLGEVAAYEVRLNAGATNTKRSIVGDSTTKGGTVSVTSLPRGAVLGWGLQASRQQVDFRAGRTTEDDRATVSVGATPDPEIRLSLRAGKEATNVGLLEKQSYDTWGGSAVWAPGPRTNVSLDADKRYFGHSHRFTLEHRMPSSSIRYSSAADATSSAAYVGVGTPITLYQLLFDQLASIQPNPNLRDQLVRDTLRLNGQDPNASAGGGFATDAVTKQRRHDLALSYLGVRTTFTVLGFVSDSQPLDTLVVSTLGARVRQLGFSSTLAYRLTPVSTLSLTGGLQKTQDEGPTQGTTLKSLALSWTEQLGLRTSAVFGARYVVFNSPTDPYRETAITASLSLRF